jgi:hypothetical protein
MHNIKLLFNDARLAEILGLLDMLHDAVSDGDLDAMTTMSKAELVGWLREIAYTAQETAEEIEADEGNQPAAVMGRNALRLLPKVVGRQ